MARTRAERRHHVRRVKANRSKYWTWEPKDKKALGMLSRTPCICSCWMCGHQRKGHGPNMQERRAIVAAVSQKKEVLMRS